MGVNWEGLAKAPVCEVFTPTSGRISRASRGHRCLLVPKKEAVKLNKEAFWAWLVHGSLERADRSRLARRAAAVAKAKKKRVCEEFGETIVKDFNLASGRFWQTESERESGVERAL